MRASGAFEFALAIALYIARSALIFVPILAMQRVIAHFEGSATFATPGALWGVIVGGLLAAPMLAALCELHHNALMTHTQARLAAAAGLALFRKALRLSPSARAGSSAGQIVNLFSTDARVTDEALRMVGMMIAAPIQIALGLYLLWGLLGLAMLAGLGFMVAIVPIQVKVFGAVYQCKKQIAAHTDRRVKLMTEVLGGVRIIKFYAWEGPFAKMVQAVRADEVAVLRRLAYIIAYGFSITMLGAPILQPVIVFVVYAYAMGEPLLASTAFTSIALFNLLRFPFAFGPMSIVNAIGIAVANARINRFLRLDELAGYVADDADAATARGLEPDVVLRVAGGTFAWKLPGAEGDETPAAPEGEKTKAPEGEKKKKLEGVADGAGGRRVRAAAADDEGAEPPASFDDGTARSTWRSSRAVATPRRRACRRRRRRRRRGAAAPVDASGHDAAAGGAASRISTRRSTRRPASRPTPAPRASPRPSPRRRPRAAERRGDAAARPRSRTAARRTPTARTPRRGRCRRRPRAARGELLRASAARRGKSCRSPRCSARRSLAGGVSRAPDGAGASRTARRCRGSRTRHCATTCLGAPSTPRAPAPRRSTRARCARTSRSCPRRRDRDRREGHQPLGGQKARWPRPRARATRARAALLDDPLGGRRARRDTFEQAIRAAAAGRTRVLVTHQTQLLHRADRVAVLAGGRIAGSAAELRARAVVPEARRAADAADAAAADAGRRGRGRRAAAAPADPARASAPSEAAGGAAATRRPSGELGDERGAPGRARSD